MRFTFAIIPAVFLASTVCALESSVSESSAGESSVGESSVGELSVSEADVSEIYNIKDMNHRIADIIEQSGSDINSILEEMEIEDIYSDLEEHDSFAEHGGLVEMDDADDHKNEDEKKEGVSLPSLPTQTDFGVITVDLKPYLNLLYNLFKPVDPVDIRNKFWDVLFKTFFEPLFEKNENVSANSVDEVLKAILKGVNPFLGGTLKIGEEHDSE